MKKFLIWGLGAIVVLMGLVLVLRSYYVLDSQKLEAAIKAELPYGTPKENVIHFVQARKPMFWDDLGAHVKARMSGRAGNLIYSKDIVLDFEFDTSGKLLSYSKKEYLTFF